MARAQILAAGEAVGEAGSVWDEDDSRRVQAGDSGATSQCYWEQPKRLQRGCWGDQYPRRRRCASRTEEVGRRASSAGCRDAVGHGQAEKGQAKETRLTLVGIAQTQAIGCSPRSHHCADVRDQACARRASR